MKLPPFSIAKLMGAVGIVALNLAAARLLYIGNLEEMLIGVSLIGLALQVGIFQITRSRGRVRAFWGGFVVCGLTSMTAFIWAIHYPGVVHLTNTGSYVCDDEPPAYTLIIDYRDEATERVLYPLLNRLHVDPMAHRDSNLLLASFLGFTAIVWFLPQIFIALVGGLLTILIGRRQGKIPSGHFAPQVSAVVPVRP